MVYLIKKDRHIFITLTNSKGEVIFHISNSMVGFKKFRLRSDKTIIHLLVDLFLKKLYKHKITKITKIILKKKGRDRKKFR